MPGKRGRYCVAECQAWIASNVQSRPEAAAEQSQQAELFRAAQLLDKQESARARKLKNDILAGQLYYRDDVERGAAELTLRIRQRLEAFPAEIAQQIPVAMRSTLVEELQGAIRLLLLEMSRWEPIE